MILTTTSTVEGKAISEYLGVVTGSDDAAKVGDEKLKQAMREMREAAEKMGADAIVGIQIAAAAGGGDWGVQWCEYTIGTAVKLK